MSDEDLYRRAERIATLFFRREDERHRFLTEIIARELRYLIDDLNAPQRGDEL